MRLHSFTRPGLLLTIGLSLLLTFQTGSAGGRDLAGDFEAANVSEIGGEIYLTFKLTITNYGDEAIAGSTIRVADSNHNVVRTVFSPIDLPLGEMVFLTAEISIPPDEYEQWRKGEEPWVTVEYQDAQGETRRGPVELVPAVIEEVGQ